MLILDDVMLLILGGQVDAQDNRDGNDLRSGKQDDRVRDQGESAGRGRCHN